MRFWKKLVLFIMVFVSIILSCSRYYIVKNNFDYSMSNRANQNMEQQVLKRYVLENNIIKSIQMRRRSNKQ